MNTSASLSELARYVPRGLLPGWTRQAGPKDQGQFDHDRVTHTPVGMSVQPLFRMLCPTTHTAPFQLIQKMGQRTSLLIGQSRKVPEGDNYGAR
jgi:hypothetical protein